MNIFVFGLFLLLTHNVSAKAVPVPKTFSEAIKEKCHLSVVDTLFKELKSLEECPVWDELNNTDRLTRDNERNVLCLLVYDSFISFCGDIVKLHLSDVKLDLQLKNDYTYEQVCQNLFPANKKLEHDLSKIMTPENCKRLCSDYDMKEPVVECSAAFYFAHFKASSLIPNPSDSNVSNILQHPSLGTSNPGQQANSETKLEKNANQASHQILNDDASGSKSKEVKTNSSSIVNAVLNSVELSSEVNGAKPEETANEAPGLIIEQHNANGTKSKVDITDLHETNEHIGVNQPEIIPHNNVHNQGIVKEILKSNNTKLVQGQVSADRKSKGLSVPENTEQVIDEIKAIAVTQNTVDAIQVNGAVPIKGQGELGTNDDKFNADQNENLPDMDDGGFEGQDDEDLGDYTGHEQQKPSVSVVNQPPKETEKSNTLESAANEENMEELDGGSYFFSYFMVICVFFVLGYVGYHNRIKVMALVLEGKRNKRQYRGRRPNSANYHKLDSNLEEAISSTCTKNANNVIY